MGILRVYGGHSRRITSAFFVLSATPLHRQPVCACAVVCCSLARACHAFLLACVCLLLFGDGITRYYYWESKWNGVQSNRIHYLLYWAVTAKCVYAKWATKCACGVRCDVITVSNSASYSPDLAVIGWSVITMGHVSVCDPIFCGLHQTCTAAIARTAQCNASDCVDSELVRSRSDWHQAKTSSRASNAKVKENKQNAPFTKMNGMEGDH